jgi:hypothetical protein
MAEIRVNSTGGVKLFDADDSHYAQIKAGTISSNTDVLELGSSAVVAGTKVDLNGQELILDADADTSITADTDDQIDFRIAGADDLRMTANAINVLSGTTLTIDSGATITNSGTANGFGALAGIDDQSSSNDDQLTITDTAVVINEDSDDVDFRVESNGNANMLFVDGGNNRVLLGSATSVSPMSLAGALQISGTSVPAMSLNRFTADEGGFDLIFLSSRNATPGSNTIVQDNDELGAIHFCADDGTDYATKGAKISAKVNGTPGANDMPTELIFATTADGANSPTQRMGIGQNGYVNIGTTVDGVYNDSSGAGGFNFNPTSTVALAVNGARPLMLNRIGDGGTIVEFYQAGGQVGTISESGGTVSYNAFAGSHWSRLADNSKPTILRGTVMDSISTLCDWYQVEFTVTIDEENVIKKESIPLPSGKSVGDIVKHTYQGVEYNAKILKEDNERLPMCKISDTEDSKAVYGVFMDWDNDPDDGVNDMLVTALGAFVVRIHKDETVAIGDYLQSKGDGTAKKQADDILRASTIAKVTSTEKTHEYADGSYCVPCTLHCG